MAWLVRAAGIPARVAFGFTKGSAQKGSTYTLTNLNLHAWTEVYFERFGWVPFDPTPATAIAGSVSTPWAPNPNLPSTGQTGQNDDPRIGQNPGAGPSASAGPGPHENFPDGGAGQAGAVASSPAWAQVSKVLLTTLSVLAALVVLRLLPAIARLVLRGRRRPDRIRVPAGRAVTVVGGTDAPGPEVFDDSPAAQAVRLRAHAAWDELVDMMVDHRFPVDPAETPRAVVDRLTRTASLTGPAAEGAQLLGTAEERARYARQPLTAADVGPALAAVRKAVQRRGAARTRVGAGGMPGWRTGRTRGRDGLRCTGRECWRGVAS